MNNSFNYFIIETITSFEKYANNSKKKITVGKRRIRNLMSSIFLIKENYNINNNYLLKRFEFLGGKSLYMVLISDNIPLYPEAEVLLSEERKSTVFMQKIPFSDFLKRDINGLLDTK